MEKKKWLWKRKSSERSPGETESSGSISSHSERFSDDQDLLKGSPNDSAQSPEVTSKMKEREEDVNGTIKSLTERLSAALLNVSAKDDLVKQHSKVAEEAVAGWEKAENEVSALKKQLTAAIQQKSALEDRVTHLDGALKECVRQLRQAREEQEEKIHEAVAKKTQEWESTKSELENQLLEAKMRANALSEATVQIDPHLLHKLEYLEQENESLKRELLSHSEELEVRTIERDLSSQAAEMASKQHLESIKKVAKLEAECRRLRAMAGRSSWLSEPKTLNASSIYVDSLTDSQSDSGERLNALDLDSSKMNGSDPAKFEQSCSDTWASASNAKFRNEKAGIRNIPASAMEIDLMDDFLEMERLAALPETGNGTHHAEPEAVVKECNDVESLLRMELESVIHRTAELEERLHKVEGEKLELERQLRMELESMIHQTAELEERLCKVEGEKVELEQLLEKTRAEKLELEVGLTKSHDEKEALKLQLKKAQLELEELQGKLSTVYESKQQIESQLITLEAEARTMSEKVNSLEAAVEKEQFLSGEMAARCEELKEELSKTKQEAELQQTANLSNAPKIKQEDLAVAAGKLAECQKTIMSLGKQLKSLATLEDFLIDTAGIPELPAKGSLLAAASGEPWKLDSHETLSPKRDSSCSRIASENSGLSASKNEGNSPSSASSSASSSVLVNHVISEKNRNGFAKIFSRSKNGIQLEI